MCPRCERRPPRHIPTHHGRVPLCAVCLSATWQAKWRRRVARGDHDIPAAEIERRFQHALAQIRRQRWTARHS